jgi:catechol 2,3-dioxygenase-like lactoylglutathione lyase family enzyme
MTDPSFIILYVASPTASAAFYADLLGKPPVEASPGFALFVLPSGLKLGLWTRQEVTPTVTAPGGGAELAIAVADDAAVDATHAAWKARGLGIAQPPLRLDFGHSFVALDPDGHRLRVFSPSQA